MIDVDWGVGVVRVVDLGRMGYSAAYTEQVRHVDEVLASRAAGRPEVGRLLVVEHDPVITVTKRAGAAGHVLASAESLAREGVELVETDRGGDVTYHGPGQLVVYPIVDLSHLNLGLHAYMRLLEEGVIRACARFGLVAGRDPTATGVWVGAAGGDDSAAHAKVCAMGVRVRKWVSMHGLALNVSPRMEHFGLIVPCGLVGRGVTSLERELAARGLPGATMEGAKAAVVGELDGLFDEQLARAEALRRAAGESAGTFIC